MNVTSMKPEQEMLRNLANLAETRAIRYRTSMKPEQEMLRNQSVLVLFLAYSLNLNEA